VTELIAQSICFPDRVFCVIKLTLSARVVAKYCDDCVCLSVCPTVYLRNHAIDLYQFLVRVAYVRGSVLLRHVYDRPHRLSPGRDFLPH